MENSSQPLSIESFSYSWLINFKPSFEDSFRASLDEASFIEMDPRKPPSKRFLRIDVAPDLNFDFPTFSQPPLSLVHADQLFCNGLIMPLTIPAASPTTSPHAPTASRLHSSSSLRRCHRLSKKIIQKYLDFLRPLCRRIRGNCRAAAGSRRRGETVPVEDKRRIQVVKKLVDSPESSPRTSLADYYWRESCDSESSIYEAVLHCKRSIGK